MIPEADFYIGRVDALLVCSLVQQGREAILETSMALSRCAWCRERTESLRYPVVRDSRFRVGVTLWTDRIRLLSMRARNAPPYIDASTSGHRVV